MIALKQLGAVLDSFLSNRLYGQKSFKCAGSAEGL